HNPKVVGSNPAPATTSEKGATRKSGPFFVLPIKLDFYPLLSSPRTSFSESMHGIKPSGK
ncbi:hypothetical protein, partial [Stutzerimonas stutzeri]|uniref:hypothetical protein n=1 Tax=Stutzerimonas stutzeri TaxID=316 RepID=UPI001EE68997